MGSRGVILKFLKWYFRHVEGITCLFRIFNLKVAFSRQKKSIRSSYITRTYWYVHLAVLQIRLKSQKGLERKKMIQSTMNHPRRWRHLTFVSHDNLFAHSRRYDSPKMYIHIPSIHSWIHLNRQWMNINVIPADFYLNQIFAKIEKKIRINFQTTQAKDYLKDDRWDARMCRAVNSCRQNFI